MKNVKSKVLAALVAATILIPTASAYAEGTTTKSKLMSAITKQQERIENTKLKKDQKAILSHKKDSIKQIHETNSVLRKQIAEKKSTLRSINKEILQNHKQLPSEELTKIQSQLQVVESKLGALGDTKGTIKTEFEKVKTLIKDKKFDAASTELDNIISIQNSRTDSLKTLNPEMDTLISMLKTALANATSATN
jgi:chromosome segregation ATPase